MKARKKSPWWRDYKRRQRKPREYLSIEMIIRKSFVQTMKEYIEKSSIVGLKEMFDSRLHWAQRMASILLFGVMLSTMIYILQYTWFDTLGKPLIVTMESSTYPISKMEFPAVALCNVNRISKKALKGLVNFLHPLIAHHNESLEQVEQYCLQAGRLIDCSYDGSTKSFNNFRETLRQQYSSRNIIPIMKELAPKCEDMLLKCSWNGEIVDCSSIFTVRRTVQGHCCAFNYVLNYDSSGRPNTTIALVKRQTVSGKYHGLTVIIDPMLDDYAYPIHNIKGFDVLIFDPTHYADPNGGRVIHRIVEPNQVELFELSSVKQRASLEVRKYPVQTRKCLFHDELKEKFGEMYSHSTCLVNCRINSLQSLCKCTPYFYPAESHQRICSIEDLSCLDKYKEKLMHVYPTNALDEDGLDRELQDSLYCPDCFPDCELTQHFVKTIKTSLTVDENYKDLELRHSFVQDVNLTDKCFLTIYQSTADGVLNRLDVVAYWFEILSNVGGFGGILLGFSIICVTELFYFFCLRFIKLIIINFKTFH